MNDNCENSDMLKKAQAEFISTVSHEMRTPLTSIRGFADTLLSSYDMLSEEQKKKFLQIIKEQANRLIKLTENLLAVSKMQGDFEKLVMKSVNVTEIIENCVRIIQQQSKKNIIKTVFENNLPYILVDTDKFQQIMLNLLENAVKYSDNGTTVTVKTRSYDKYILIEVSDKGIKIAENDRERIFEKFTRLSSVLTQKTEGSGLGLYITKILTEKMNGKIEVESTDELTTFKLTFPISGYGDDAGLKMRK